MSTSHPIRFDQACRDTMFFHPDSTRFIDDTPIPHPSVAIARKTSRVLAIQIGHVFTVQTDRGVMAGEPGDWLVTNHPDDDAGSDVWSISDARFRATYVIDHPGEPLPASPSRARLLRFCGPHEESAGRDEDRDLTLWSLEEEEDLTSHG